MKNMCGIIPPFQSLDDCRGVVAWALPWAGMVHAVGAQIPTLTHEYLRKDAEQNVLRGHRQTTASTQDFTLGSILEVPV